MTPPIAKMSFDIFCAMSIEISGSFYFFPNITKSKFWVTGKLKFIKELNIGLSMSLCSFHAKHFKIFIMRTTGAWIMIQQSCSLKNLEFVKCTIPCLLCFNFKIMMLPCHLSITLVFADSFFFFLCFSNGYWICLGEPLDLFGRTIYMSSNAFCLFMLCLDKIFPT